MSDGIKSWYEEEERREALERETKFKNFAMNVHEALDLFDSIKARFNSLTLSKTPMTRYQHHVTEQLEELLRKLP